MFATGESRSLISWGRDVAQRFCEWIAVGRAAAADGRAAPEYVENGQPLFTDVAMPGGMTARRLAAAANRRQPETKILCTSGYTENAIIHHGRLDQGVMSLSKPCRKSELTRMARLAPGDATVEFLESQLIPLADTSIGVPTRQQPASVQALS